MIGLERHGERDADGEVGEDAEQSVGQRPAVAERQVVGELVNRCGQERVRG